jgi:PAS domain S-box-containing protein
VDNRSELRFLAAGGDLAALIRAHEWWATPLGSPAMWPAALCTLVEVLLGARQPMFVAWGPQNVIIYNQAYAEILGNKHPDALGRPLLEVWPEIRDDLLPIVERVGSGLAVHMEDIMLVIERHGYPEEAHFAFSYTPIRDGETGDVEGFFCACTETTAHVMAERRLRDSEAQFRALAQAVPNHAWTARPDGDLEWFNNQVFAYSGLGFSALAGEGWAQIVHPDDLLRAADAWDRALSSGDPYEIEFRIRRADGMYRWHIVRAQPITGPNGIIIRWVGTNTDIEDQRVAAQALAALNAELEQQVMERTSQRDRVWRNSRDLLAVLGSDGGFRAVNPAWTTMLGHLPAEVVARGFLDFVWPDDVHLARISLDTAASQQDLTNFEIRLGHKDGTPRWISWRTSLEGGLIYAYGRDITSEKEQAEALRQTEEALRQAQKMEAVGQLTGGLAHDFNNLLTGITGSLELLRMRVAQGRMTEIDRYFTAAQGAAKRAAALTHRLLAFSRRQTLDPRPTDVNRLIAEMEELIRRTMGPAVAIEVVGATGLWTTLVDPNQLENALLNLCINARDAMPDGGRLTIATSNKWMDERAAREQELPSGQYISLSVSDTGSGMTPEVIRRAFDPFYTTKPIGVGTGLGLSMIYGFVRQSGGQARIYSEPGQGATVCLYLPRHLGKEAEADEPASPSVPQRAEDGQVVLIVDDEVTVRMLVAEVLEERGYTSIEAADGPLGLRILELDRRIDLLITDVGLPGGINGRQLADAARIARPGLKVLFITGYAEAAVVRNGHLEPGMHVLTKPFTIEDLATRLRDIVGEQSGEGGSSPQA